MLSEGFILFSTWIFTVSLQIGDTHVDPVNSIIWGPGLSPDDIVMPARYFFIDTVDSDKNMLKESPGDIFDVSIKGNSSNRNCRVWVNTLDRKDGSFIVRYKVYQTCYNFEIHITYQGVHVSASPYKFTGAVYPEECFCPMDSISAWADKVGCKNSYAQIESDLKPFQSVNFTLIRNDAIQKFNNPGSMSVCNYVIKNNQVYRECFGKHVGFNMFIDAILLSLARKMHLPDMEVLFNLGDWPLANKGDKLKVPIFSWCSSEDHLDIVMPTYDITESTLECMGRVMLDMLSVQGNIDKRWHEKIEQAFWRGRDSRHERLELIDIARKYPDLFNASLTNFFFFRDEEEKYGPKEKHVSFFKFFDYKYQLNIDGTVAAYRFPYLLAGDSLVFKQDSKYYEYFYKLLEPWKHYVPFNRDLSDLVDMIKWAKENDNIAKEIALNGQMFARDNLMPRDVFCYHAVLFKEWSTRLVSDVYVRKTMEHVPQPDTQPQCKCLRKISSNQYSGGSGLDGHDEL